MLPNLQRDAGYLRLGAGIARKGWLTREDVVKTLPLERLRKELQAKRSKLGKLAAETDR